MHVGLPWCDKLIVPLSHSRGEKVLQFVTASSLNSVQSLVSKGVGFIVLSDPPDVKLCGGFQRISGDLRAGKPPILRNRTIRYDPQRYAVHRRQAVQSSQQGDF